MRKFLISIALALASTCALGQAAGTAPAIDPCFSNTPKSSVPINVTTATTTQLVALSAGKVVYVCGGIFTVNSVVTTATTAQFEYGTGASCGTGTTALTGLFNGGNVTAGIAVPIILPADYSSFQAPAGNALCLVSAGTTVQIQGVLTFIQQ